MAIAFDAKSLATSNNVTASPLTFSHTCSGENRVLFVTITVNTNGGYQATNFSITYGGVAMTALDSAYYNDVSGKVYTFYLVNPASGANNIVVSYTPGLAYYFNVHAISLTGVDQTNPIDVHGANTFTTNRPFDTTFTTNYKTLVCYGMTRSASYGLSAYSGTIAYTYDGQTKCSFYWSAGSAGPKTISLNWPVTNGNANLCYVAFRELAAAGPANLKSLNTNLKANIKSTNTNLIANVKSLNTNV